MAHLSIRVLGPLEVSLAGEPVSGFPSDKVRALLVYLALAPDRPHRRESLAGLLWPEFSERSARTNLRNALAKLRRVLGEQAADVSGAGSPPFLESTRQTIQFNSAGNVWVDALAFEELVATEPPVRARLEDALSQVRGSFLEGFSLADAAGFEEWQLLRREHYCRLEVEALDRLVAIYEAHGDYEEALSRARRRVRLEPWQEDGLRQLMRLLTLSGQLGPALAQYERYCELLAEELGVEPSAETQAVYESLLKGELPPRPPVVVRPVERAPRVVGACPYRGLAAFREVDAPFFFGREGFVEDLLQTLHERPQVVVIVGTSGSGKSSAVMAGLLPHLRETGDWLIAGFRPGGEPFQALAAALITLLEPELGETDRLTETHKLAEALGRRDVSLQAVVERALEKAVGSAGTGTLHLLLLVDQFEEAYTMCADPETRRRFVETLLAAAEAGSARRQSPLVLLLTLRADFMGQALAHRTFADALQARALMLGPMTREEIRTAIVKPAEVQGAALEEGLVERLLDGVGDEPGRLPLLEFALTLLWERLDQGWLTHAAYEEIGRVDGALARYAEEVFDELTVDEQDRARRIFLQLVQPGEGTEDTRRLATRAELGEGDWPLVQHLADRRLVVTGRNPGSGAETVEVVHEALLQRWGRLRGWMEADRVFRTWQEGLRVALRAWESSDRDEGALLRGAPLVEARGWLEERAAELGDAEAAFIGAGMALRERRQLVRDRRRRRTILALAGGLVVALVLALLAAGQWQKAKGEVEARAAAEAIAVQEREAARSEADGRATAEAVAVQERHAARSEADSRATAEAVALVQREEALRQASIGLAAKALAELEGTAPERAVLLALEALEAYPYTPQAESALARAVHEHVPYVALRGVPHTRAVAWSPSGATIAGASEEGLFIWDADSGHRTRTIPFPDEACLGHDVAWSPNGDRLVAVGTGWGEGVGEECISPAIWDVDRAARLLVFTGHEGQTNSVDWSPDGGRILSGGVDGTARIWDAVSGAELLTLSGHAGGVNDVAWSPDGGRVAAVASDGTARVWDVGPALKAGAGDAPETDSSTSTELPSFAILSGPAGSLTSAAWSPDGERIATADSYGVVQVWLLPEGANPTGDAASGELLFTLSGHSKEVRGVAWSPDGQRIASSSADGTVRLWDAATGEELDTLRGLSGDLWSVTWSPFGDRLVAGGGTLLPVWDVCRLPFRLSGHTADVQDVQWSPDGTKIGTTSHDGTARIWDAATGEELLAMEHPAGVRFFAWSPDGSRIITTCQDRFARVWDTGSGALLLKASAPEGEFFAAASWSPDGSRFAASRPPADVITVYDAATGDPLTSFRATARVHRVPWSPEGDRIVTGGESGGRVFDTSTGRQTLILGDVAAVNGAWSPDGGRIVLGHSRGVARVVDASSGEDLLLFAAHSDDIWDATWSPDGKRIVSGDVTGDVRVWDAATGEVVLSFRVPGAVYSVDWSPDGTNVAAGGYFYPPVIRRAWQSTEDLVAYARECCVARELTPAERQDFGLPER